MKNLISTLATLLLCSSCILAQAADCSRTTFFGEAEICLPSIEGYQECYLEPIVKQLADGTEVAVNTVLGYYLEDQTFERRDSLGLFDFDNYFKVYATKQLKDFPANKAVLQQLQENFASNFTAKNWEEIEEGIDEVDVSVEVGVPTIIKSYELSDNSFTYLLLTTYEPEGAEPYTLVISINCFVVKERLIWMAYYLNYKGKETVESSEKNSNLILSSILEANE